MIGLGSDNEVEMVSKLLLIRFLYQYWYSYLMYTYPARTQPDISTQAMVRLWHTFLLLNIFPLTAVTSHILNIELQFLKPILLVHEDFCIHFLTHLLYIHNSNWNKNLDSQYFGMMMIRKGIDHQPSHDDDNDEDDDDWERHRPSVRPSQT